MANDWYYKGKPFVETPEEYHGFVYLITNTVTQQKYIGKKSFWSHRTKKVPGRKNRKHLRLTSDWATYWSSSDDLKEAFEKYPQSKFKREIIRLCVDKRTLTYGELEFQVKFDVLTKKLKNGEYEYYNRNIMGKFFRSTFNVKT